MSNRKAIGKRIRTRRKEAGLTQAQLGKLMGVGQTAVVRWEAGTVEIGTDMLGRLEKELQTPAGFFMGGGETQPFIRRGKIPKAPEIPVPDTRPSRKKAQSGS